MVSGSALGLYSISVHERSLENLESWAAEAGVAFLHLRGGARGFDVLSPEADLTRRVPTGSQCRTPVTMLTSELELASLTEAREESIVAMKRYANAASMLGASVVRVLACRPPEEAPLAPALSSADVTLAVELHHPAWFEPKASSVIRHFTSQLGVGILLDTAQVADAGASTPVISALVGQSRWLHVNLRAHDEPPLRHLPVIAACLEAGVREVALEWVGEDRSHSECLRQIDRVRNWLEEVG